MGLTDRPALAVAVALAVTMTTERNLVSILVARVISVVVAAAVIPADLYLRLPLDLFVVWVAFVLAVALLGLAFDFTFAAVAAVVALLLVVPGVIVSASASAAVVAAAAVVGSCKFFSLRIL